MSLLCRDQFLRIGKFGLLSLALVFVSYWHVPKSLAQQIRVVPSISVLEQYDSNVFFTPKSQLTAGTKADDLITTLTPQLNFMNNTNLLKANVSLGAVVQKFAHNSELDNVGFNASTGIDLSQAVNRVLPRMTALRVFGTYRYSPSTPAFGAGGLGGGVGGGGGFGMGGVGISGPVDYLAFLRNAFGPLCIVLVWPIRILTFPDYKLPDHLHVFAAEFWRFVYADICDCRSIVANGV